MDYSVNVDELGGAIRIHADSHGNGSTTLLLVHGWATTRTLWESLLALPPPENVRFVAIDLPGVGWSSKPAVSYSLAGWAAAVAALVAQLDGEVVLVGHSMGGTIAMAAALSLGERISRLVLVSPVPASGVPLPEEAVAAYRAMAGRKDGMQHIIGSMMQPGVSVDVLDNLVSAAATITDRAFVDGLDAWRLANFADQLGGLRVPVRVLSGALEQPLTPDLLRGTVLQQISGATLTVLDGVGHYPQVEAPGAFAAALYEAAFGA